MADLKRTPLYDTHVEAGAKLVDFAGWEMPVQYEGIKAEHAAVRESCGVFDVSHMGEIETEGPGAGELLQRLLTNDVSKLEVGAAQYSCLCREDGGVLDDLFTYRLGEDHYLTVTNASNHDKDLAWFREHAEGFDADVVDRFHDYAMLAVQGPNAREVMRLDGTGRSAEALPNRRHEPRPRRRPRLRHGLHGRGRLRGVRRPRRAPPRCGRSSWWPELFRRASARGTPCVSRSTTPSTAMTWTRSTTRSSRAWDGSSRSTPASSGPSDAPRSREAGPERLLKPLVLDEGIPRQGNAILSGGEEVGVVTSGTLSPSLGYGIGMGYVRTDLASEDTAIEIDVRGKRRPGRVEKVPLYDGGSA